MTKLSSVTILLQNNLEKPDVIVIRLDSMNIILINVVVVVFVVVVAGKT